MKTIHFFFLLVITTFATGCPTGPSKSFPSKDSLVAKVNEYLVVQQGRYNCALDVGKDYNAVTKQCGTNDISSPEALAQRVRNDSIEDALAVIDSNYTDFISKLDTSRSTTDFVADVIDLGIGAATGITKGERPNQILGIAFTAFRGGRRSADLNFYKQQTTPILIAKMDDSRSKQYAAMLSKKPKPVSEYSMKEAIRDVVNYYNSGTLVRAFANLSQDTSAQARDSETVVRELKGENVTISSIPTIKHSNISDEVFAHSRNLARQLRTAQSAPEAERAARLTDITVKYEAIWKAIENNEHFAPFLTQMKADPRFSDIFQNLATNRSSVTPEQFDKLIANFTALVSRASKETGNSDLFEEFLDILRRADK